MDTYIIVIIVIIILILLFVGYKYHLEQTKKRLAEEARLNAKFTVVKDIYDIKPYPGFHTLTFMKMDAPNDYVQTGFQKNINVPTRYDCMRRCENEPPKEVNCYPKTKEFEGCLNSGANDCYNRFNYKNMYDYSATPTKVKASCNSYLYNQHKDDDNGSCKLYRSCPDRMDEFELEPKGKSFEDYSQEFGYIRDKPINYMINMPYDPWANSAEAVERSCKTHCDNIKGCKGYKIYKEPNVQSSFNQCRITM